MKLADELWSVQRGDSTDKSEHGTGPEVGSSEAGHALRAVAQHSSGSRLRNHTQGGENTCWTSWLWRGLPLHDWWTAASENDAANMADRIGWIGAGRIQARRNCQQLFQTRIRLIVHTPIKTKDSRMRGTIKKFSGNAKQPKPFKSKILITHWSKEPSQHAPNKQ